MLTLLHAFYSTTVCLGLSCTAPGDVVANPWQLIEQISYEETETADSWSVKKIVPEALRAQAQDFQITGYYVPIQAQAQVTQFLLVPDPADCPFCGQNGYGPALEVTMARPLPDMPEATELTIAGILKIDDSPETYRAVYVTNARRVK